MKTAEEYIVIGGDKIPSTEMIYASHKTVCKMIEQAQRDAYNEALMDAAMNVRLYKAANSGSWLDAAINTDSILKLKKQ